VQRDTSPPSAPLALFTFVLLLAPVTNWEPHSVTLAGYCYAMRHGMKVQIVTAYRVSHLQRYGVTVRGNVTSVSSSSSSSSYGSTTFNEKFWPSHPVPSIFFYTGQRFSNLALLTSVHLFNIILPACLWSSCWSV
jgi:hypothetical protein